MPHHDKNDDKKVEKAVDDAQEAADKAEESTEKSASARDEAEEAQEKVEDAVEEVKEVVAEVKKEPKAAEETKKASKPVSANLEKIIKTIEELSVLELSELVKALEDRFGVTAAAPMAVATASAGPAAASEGPSEEQTTFNVILANSGANKISAIKAVRELVPTLGLKEAKDLVDTAPKEVMSGVNKATAEEAKTKLTAAGATVELK